MSAFCSFLSSYNILQTDVVAVQKVFYDQHPPFSCEFLGLLVILSFIDRFFLRTV